MRMDRLRLNFWILIDEARSHCLKETYHHIQQRVEGLSRKERLNLAFVQRELLEELDTQALYEVAVKSGRGLSDDGWLAFRLWLISRGSQVFASVIEDPQALLDLISSIENKEKCEFEPFAYVFGTTVYFYDIAEWA